MLTGTISSTLAWFLIDPSHNSGPDMDAGIYGFNGFLIGEAMGNFVSSGSSEDGSFGIISSSNPFLLCLVGVLFRLR